MKAYIVMTPGIPTITHNDPLLLMGKGKQVMTGEILRQYLRVISDTLGLGGHVTLHGFKHSCATLCYNAGVDFNHFRQHGTWSSDASWVYITKEAIAETSPIPYITSNLVK